MRALRVWGKAALTGESARPGSWKRKPTGGLPTLFPPGSSPELRPHPLCLPPRAERLLLGHPQHQDATLALDLEDRPWNWAVWAENPMVPVGREPKPGPLKTKLGARTLLPSSACGSGPRSKCSLGFIQHGLKGRDKVHKSTPASKKCLSQRQGVTGPPASPRPSFHSSPSMFTSG